MDTIAVVGACTGVAALGLSIYNTCRQMVQDQPSLRVELSFGIYQGLTAAQLVLIKFTNIGGCNVFVSSCHLEIAGSDMKAHLLPSNLPRMLEPKNGGSEFWYSDSLKESLRREGFSGEIAITGVSIDATGKKFRSVNSLTIDV